MPNLNVITAPVSLPDFSEISKAQAPLIEQAATVVIQNVEQQTKALELLKDIRSNIKAAKEKFKSIKDPMNAAKNAVLAWEHEIIDPWEATEAKLSKANSDFLIAEKKRADDEAREAARKIREEQERAALEEAQRLADSGKNEQAETVIEEAIAAPAPIVKSAPVVAKVAGISSRVNYSCEVVDLKALIEYCISKPDLIAVYLQANETALNALARQRKDAFVMPGCKLNTRYV